MLQRHDLRKANILWLLTLLPIPACNTSSTKDITAKAGDPCQDCDQCCQIGSCCICDRCSQVAYDPVNNQLLVCNAATLQWRVDKECPGGGYARCVDNNERTSCIVADGGQVL